MKKFRISFRLIVSVAAGIATSVVLSVITHLILYWLGIFPALHKPMFETRLVIISLCYHSLFAIVAGFVTAMIARDEARKAVFVLGSKEAIMWILGMILLWHHSPPWFNITKAILGPPLAWIGGRVYKGYQKSKAALQ